MSFSVFGFRISEASTGISVSESTSEPAIAKAMVNAIGLNSFPSRPSSANNGRNTTIMMMIAKAIGFATSLAAASTAEVRLTFSPCAWRSAMRRKAFSTITTAPSTIMPMPIARPASDIRLAERPNCCMPMNAISIASGRATMTTSAERSSPRNRNSTTATRIEPSTSAAVAVPTALLTRSVRW